jgi:transposase
MATKEESLRESGSFNKRFMKVSAGVFTTGSFFDAKDLVQVKYEMLRAVEKDGGSVTDVAGEFGFSRKTYYQVHSAYEEGGLGALMPKKAGPKGPSKLHGEVAEFIDSCADSGKPTRATDIASQLEAALGVRVHPRTIERYLEKKTAPPGSR